MFFFASASFCFPFVLALFSWLYVILYFLLLCLTWAEGYPKPSLNLHRQGPDPACGITLFMYVIHVFLFFCFTFIFLCVKFLASLLPQVLLLFPHVVNAPLDKFQGALLRTLQVFYMLLWTMFLSGLLFCGLYTSHLLVCQFLPSRERRQYICIILLC